MLSSTENYILLKFDAGLFLSLEVIDQNLICILIDTLRITIDCAKCDIVAVAIVYECGEHAVWKINQ